MIEQVKSWLTARSWQFQQRDADTLLTGFTCPLPEGGEHFFWVYVQRIIDSYGDVYLRLSIVPFVEQPTSGYPTSLFFALAEINHDLPLLKFATDGDHALELVGDLRADHLERKEFDALLQTLTDYAAEFYLRLATAVVAEEGNLA